METAPLERNDNVTNENAEKAMLYKMWIKSLTLYLLSLLYLLYLLITPNWRDDYYGYNLFLW